MTPIRFFLSLLIKVQKKINVRLNKTLLSYIGNTKRLQPFLSNLIERKEIDEGVFITLHSRPIHSNGVGTFSDTTIDSPNVAIVMQGPLIKENEFTLNTIQIYKKNFSTAIIIVSTWEGEDSDCIDKIKLEGVDVVLSEKPNFAGFSNVNFQIISSTSGIKKAIENGAEYVFKTRTDQRMYAPNIQEYMLSILNIFPITHCYGQKQRLVALSLNTFKYRLYGVSDMFMFGHVSDMLNYWDCAFDNRVIEQYPYYSVLEISKARTCEVYLFTQYLQKLGLPFPWSLKDSFKSIAAHFVIVNKEDLDFYWPKYVKEEYRWLSYKGISMSQEILFREWLCLYGGVNTKATMDIDLDVPFEYSIMRN